ncbi:MAG: lysophospholipid acyltransferase family protein [Acidobacteriota bacterium]|nr:lysophospholipid acyltransferase family protein [Acidobacteriota bacterium]
MRELIAYRAAQLVLQSLARTPLPIAKRLARLYAATLDRLIPRLRRVGMRNLEMAFPQLSRTHRKLLINGVFRSIGRLLVALARFPQINSENVYQWIRYEGYEHFEAALARGKGVLFATAHLGNWELSAFAHALLSAPMHVVVRPLDNPLIDAVVEQRRALSGNHLIGKRDFSRAILKALHRNEAVGILVDQNSALDNSVFVDFFGTPACTSLSFARIAAHSGASVIPGFAVWSESESRYILRFYPAVEMSGDAGEDTRRIQKTIEAAIAEYPDQWLWIHRRWKTRPPGEPPLYD